MEIFDVTTTDVPFYDKLLKNGKGIECVDVEVIAKVEYMSVNQYFEQCAKLHNSTVTDEYKYIDECNMSELMGVIETNKLPIGFLNMVNKTQEGRHRALLAKRLGIESIPVLVIKTLEGLN